MYNINSGYVGASRSVRSQEAINSFEVPISMINKSLIDNFIVDAKDDFSKDELEYLKTISTLKWKYVAKEKTHPSSWHHTSKYFNKTNHYSLIDIAEKIIESKNTLDKEYEAYQQDQKKEKENIKYGVIKVQVWGGSRRSPKLEGYKEAAGIIKGDWLYYKYNHLETGSVYKYKTTANKTEWIKEYNSYSELVENHKEYENTEKVFNKLILEKKTPSYNCLLSGR